MSMNDTIITADCMEKLEGLDSNSVHAIVTDPPYGLAFMGKSWDDFEPKEYQEFCENWARRAKTVLKPGGHLLAFSGNRTHHRLFSGLEDAGFEIRDTLTWHYGSGFPKASDISKTIDKRKGAERETIEERENWGASSHDEEGKTAYGDYEGEWNTTKPATDTAEKWDGWKTGLKPATEYIVLARKPFEGATVDCVLEHGTGALNIGDCRVGNEERTFEGVHDQRGGMVGGDNSKTKEQTVEGRYPSNVIFDELEAERLDSSHEDTAAGEGNGGGEGGIWNESVDGEPVSREYGDEGGISRYFYTSKASKSERTLDGFIENGHPTVKPQDLMEWLIKLVTREEQIVLDPFAGSGTTLKAAKNLNRQFIGMEKSEKWADVARVRCNLTPENPEIVRADNAQSGVEEWV